MIAVLNYANDAYKKHQRINSWTAKHIGKVDKVYSFSPEDIDKDFYEQNKNILSQKRGNGLWLWKPYFILKTMNELSYGDCLIYLDSGNFYISDAHSLVQKLKDSNQDIMLFEIPLIESQWTKKEVFLYMDAYTEKIRFTNQIMGTIIIIISEKSVTFIQKWLELCLREELIFPKEKDQSEDFMYIAHREDQSILSVLAKKEGIIPFSDPSDHGKFPIQYLVPGYLFRNEQKKENYQLKQVYFILARGSNPMFYLLKYWMRCILSKIKLTVLRWSLN
jgi:hypothetical protein